MPGGSRPGSGRKKTSPALKLVTGTYRPDRDGPAVPDQVPLGPMVAPADLNDRERFFFAETAKMLEQQKRASPHYEPTVTLLARRLAHVERLSAVIEVVGDTYETKTQAGGLMIRARPEVVMRSDAMRQAQSLLGELMLSPAAALKIAEGGRKPEANPFDDV